MPTQDEFPLRQKLVAVSLGIAFLAIPLYPAFISLTGAPIPGVLVLPRALTLALLALVAAMVVVWCALLLTSARRPLPTVAPLAAFPGAALLAAALGLDPLSGALFIAILGSGVVWHAAILRFFREPHVAESIFWCYVVSGLIASLAAIVLVVTKTPVALYTIGHGRAVGTFVLPGELAGYLILYVPVAIALARTSTDAALRRVAWAGVALGSTAFVMTFSRAGWAGMAAAIAVFVLLLGRRNGSAYAVGIVGAAAVVLAFFFNVHHDPSENFTRLPIWQTAAGIVQRFPLTGVGPFDFARIYPFVHVAGGEPTAFHAHSVVLTIAAETGLVGVAALLFGWWRFVVVFRRRMRAGSAPNVVAAAIAAGLAGTWVQGAIDTVSVVIFGLWLPFMALALSVAGDDPPESARNTQLERAPSRRRGTAVALAVAVLAVPCLFVQIASVSAFAAAASPASLASHLPRRLGIGMYERVERVAPLPFVETVLAGDALQRGDLVRAREHAARLPAGAVRSDLYGRASLAEGFTDDATALFLEAGDDQALQRLVTRLERTGRVRDAYALEARVRDRLAAAETRPNALADSWWRLGRLALRLGDRAEAERDLGRAVALAPLNTKYLIAAGTLALQRHDPAAAVSLFARASDVDPSDADAIAGVGLALLQRGDRAGAARLSSRADAINPHATLALQLGRALRGVAR